MAMVKYKGMAWDVDSNGHACIITPGIPAATETAVPKKRLERQIAKALSADTQ